MNQPNTERTGPWRKIRPSYLGWGVLILAVIVGLPRLVSIDLATDILVYGLAAIAFNLLLGYAGILSFGQAAFFGIGAYGTGYMLLRGADIVLASLVGIALAALAAFVVAFFSARARTIYFVLLTLAFAQMVYFVALTWSSVTGGANGLLGFQRPSLGLRALGISIATPTGFYGFTVVIFLACLYLYFRILRSPLGQVFRAMRENEGRLRGIGYNTTLHKILVFVLAGALSGVAGVLYAMHWEIVPVTLLNLNQSAAIAFMALLGGLGNPLGPIAGAAIYIWLSDFVSLYWARWPIAFGAFIIFVVLFLRGGLAEAWTRLSRWIKRRAAS